MCIYLFYLQSLFNFRFQFYSEISIDDNTYKIILDHQILIYIYIESLTNSKFVLQ